MNWGQAVSDDMFHWKESDDALKPDDHGTMFSGSGVVAWENTSGPGDTALTALATIQYYNEIGKRNPY